MVGLITTAVVSIGATIGVRGERRYVRMNVQCVCVCAGGKNNRVYAIKTISPSHDPATYVCTKSTY